ncbi:tRNA (guanosine(46)-N7)-methyltransferase TrmB [Prochlorococcus sp. MIT 1223]|uniref:tRNA (guanosine(46)-N7)-methyltransferase TrmB n=1 Tax=Prochlorococcus sp. MIT 1223 TaxID=3096217 RepID=UPI002A7547F8|nr:tRNA (guanosine(46)-N7)-methyltransferase TrmB [Prochlorococcus sp. MIT 1223]
MRQHVNPLSRFFQLPIEIPQVKDLFANIDLPIHLDIGCAKGRFLLDLASLDTTWNYLGIEIRNKLVLSAKKDKDRLKLANLNFSYCNANVSLEKWLNTLNHGNLRRVSIQFPDPWFKRRHYKRRVLQPSLLLSLIKSFKPGAELFLQSDVFSVIKPMIDLVDSSQCFTREPLNDFEWLDENPFSVVTEREHYAMANQLKIYRVLYRRNANDINLSGIFKR